MTRSAAAPRSRKGRRTCSPEADPCLRLVGTCASSLRRFSITRMQRGVCLGRLVVMVTVTVQFGTKADSMSCRVWFANCTMAHPPTAEHETAHSCGKGHEGCCNLHHVRWVTYHENRADMVAHGAAARGEHNGNAKLTASKVRQIRASSSRTGQELAKRFGVSDSLISAVRLRQIWGHVE